MSTNVYPRHVELTFIRRDRERVGELIIVVGEESERESRKITHKYILTYQLIPN